MCPSDLVRGFDEILAAVPYADTAVIGSLFDRLVDVGELGEKTSNRVQECFVSV